MASTAHTYPAWRWAAISGPARFVAHGNGRWDCDRGCYRIYGTIRVDGSPAARRVRLFQRHTGRLVRQTMSGSDGAYEFADLAHQEYFVVADDDPQATFNAAIADRVVPEKQGE